MMKDHRLAKTISDASWSGFYRKLEYKMAEHDRDVNAAKNILQKGLEMMTSP